MPSVIIFKDFISLFTVSIKNAIAFCCIVKNAFISSDESTKKKKIVFALIASFLNYYTLPLSNVYSLALAPFH